MTKMPSKQSRVENQNGQGQTQTRARAQAIRDSLVARAASCAGSISKRRNRQTNGRSRREVLLQVLQEALQLVEDDLDQFASGI